MTTIDHAGPLAMSRPATLSDERVASRALQVARRTALGVLGDSEAAADIAQDVVITAVRRAGSLREGEPTPEEIARVLAAADELRSPRSLAPPRRCPARAAPSGALALAGQTRE
jgi:hypothetical protein